MHKKYAKALFDLIQEKPEDTKGILEKFKSHLERKAELKLLARTLKELEILLEKSEKSLPYIEVYSEDLKDKAEQKARSIKEDSYIIKVNKSLIGGYRIKTRDGKFFDASFKKHLLDLYNTLRA